MSNAFVGVRVDRTARFSFVPRAFVVALLGLLGTLVLAFATTSAASAAGAGLQDSGSVQGTVRPSHDHPLTLATARIPDLALEVTVSPDGSFVFDNVRPGSYLIQVRVPTLGSGVERVTVRSGEASEVIVEVNPGSHFEEVVVSAPGDARDQLELASAVTSLSGQELRLRMEASLGETLAQEPGVSSSFFGPGASRPIIRGLSGDRVRVLEGGIGSGDASAVSSDHAVTTDPAQAERIEILRGPATLLYGSSAIGGAVNVIDERIPSTRASSPVRGTVDLSGGTVADARSGVVNLNGGGGDWAWHVDAVIREADEYDVPRGAILEDEDKHDDEHEEEGHDDEEEGHDEDEHGEEDLGFVENSDIETQSARFGVTRFFGDRGFLGVSVSGFETEYGLPGGHGHEEEGEHGEEHGEEDGEEHEDEEEEHGDEEEEVVRIDMEQRRLDLRGEARLDSGLFQALKLRVGATDYEHVELEGTEVGTLFFNDYLETRIEAVQRKNGRLAGSVGLQYSDRDLEAIGAEAFIPKSNTERMALFTFQEIDQGRLTWQLGARFETQDNAAVGFRSLSHEGLSASLGAVFDISEGWSLGASLARSVKLPNTEELFSDGPHIASQAFEIGDPTLTEETGLGLDLSLRKNEGVLTGELTLFRQDFSDFIFQALTGEEEDGLPVVLWSQGDAELSGAELKARVELLDRSGHHLHLEFVGDVVEADLDAGGNVPRIPPLRLGGGLHYHSENWGGNVEVRWIDDQSDIAENETATEGYTLVNASLSRRFILGGQILDLLLRGRNLTDEVARSHTSFLKNVAPLPGRDVSLSARFWF